MAEREVKIVITGEDRSKKALKAGEKNWKKFGKNITGFIGSATKALAKLGAAAAIGIGAISVTSIKTAIEVESAFAGVIKTTEGLVDEFGILNKVGEDLRGEFRALALEIPTDLPDLMQVGELGGQLGIAKESLVGFTKTVAALGEATNLTREQAATSFAQISNIMGTSQRDFDRMGSSVVALGNNFATTEADIVNFATRIAATGRIAGITEADVFGIAAAFTSVGVQAEAGGTAVQKVLTAMTKAVAGNTGEIIDNTAAILKGQNKLTDLATSLNIAQLRMGEFTEKTKQSTRVAAQARIDKLTRQITEQSQALVILRGEHGKMSEAGGALETFAKVAGLTADEFKIAFEEDAAGAFTAFVEGLGEQGDKAFDTLEALELGDQRLIRAFLSLAGAGDLLSETIAESNAAWEDNTALTKEAEARYRTFASQLKIAKNIIKDIALSIGEALLPFVREMLVAVAPLIKEFAEKLPELLETKVIPAIQGVIGVIGEIIDAIREGDFGEVARILGGHLRTMYSKALEWVEQNIGPLVDAAVAFLTVWVADWVTWLSTNIGPFAKDLGEKIRDWIGAATEWVKDNAEPLKEKIGATLKAWAAVAVEWFKNNVVPKVAALGEKIRDWLSGAVTWVKDNWGDIIEKAGATLQAWATAVVEWFKNNVVPKAIMLGDKIRKWIEGAIDWAGDQATDLGIRLGDVLRDVSITAVDWFEGNVTPVVMQLGETFATMVADALAEAEATFPEASISFGGKLRQLVIDADTFVNEQLPTLSASLGTTLGNILRSAIGLFAESGTFIQMRDEMFFNIWKGIIAGSAEDPNLIVAGWTALRDAVTSMWEAFIVAVTGDPDFKQTLVDWWHGLLTDALDFVLKLPVPWTDIGRDMIAGIIQGIKDKWNDLKKDLESRIKSLPPLVRNILGARSPSRLFAEIGIDMMKGLAEGIDEEAAQVIKKLSKAIGRIVNAFSQLVELQKGFGLAGGQLPDIGPFLDQFELTIRTLFWRIEGLIEEFGEKRIKRVRKSAKRLREIIQAVMFDMSGIALVNLPDMGMWRDQVIALTRAVMQALGHLAFEFGEKGLEAAAGWAKSVQAILGLVKPGVDALKAMLEFVPIQNLPELAAIFATQLLDVVDQFMEARDDYVIVFEEGAVAWWNAVKSIVGVIKPGVDALAALLKFVPIENLAELAALFVTQLLDVVDQFAEAKDSYVIVFAEDAKEWWANVKASIGIIKSGVEALKAILEFVPVANLPELAALFATQLLDVVDQFSETKDSYVIVFSEAAKAWWDSVKSSISVIEPGIKALKALLEWDEALSAPMAAREFARALFDVVEELEDIASEYDVTFTDEALKFFDAVKKAISIIAPGVKALEKLGEFVAVKNLLTQMDIFKGQMKLVIDKMIELAGNYETEGLEAVQKFGIAVEEIFKGVKVALEALKKMLKLPETGEIGLAEAADFFEDVMTEMVTRLGLIAVDMETTGLAQAQKFADAAVRIRTAILAGINSILVLGEAGLPGLGGIPIAVGSMVDQIIAVIRSKLTEFFNIGFAMGRSLAQGIILGMQSGLANIAGALPVVGAQHGFSGVVTRPTLFLAGEAGPESVNITPGGASGGIHIENLNVSGTGNAGADVRNTIRMLEFGTVSP